jgi:NarL family two-component system response regulator LiaR
VLFDRFPLWLDAIAAVVARGGFDTIRSATTPTGSLRLLDKHQPELHVASLDGFADRSEALDYLASATTRAPGVRIIAMSDDADRTWIDDVLDADVAGCVLKNADPDDLAAAIRQAFAPTLYLPDTPQRRPPSRRAEKRAMPLTEREIDVLRLVADGHSNANVARILGLSEQTVKFHLSNVYRKLAITNRTEASRWAHTHGLLEPA